MSLVIAAAAITGAPLQVTHVTSSGCTAAPRLLQIIREARSHGLDVTVDFYPYTAAMTKIESALFDEGWQQAFEIGYREFDEPNCGRPRHRWNLQGPKWHLCYNVGYRSSRL